MESEAYYYQGIRTMGHSQYQGASVSESLKVLNNIETDNPEDWYQQWYDMAQYQISLIQNSGDNAAKGRALLRASNYYRTSEFFLEPQDPRRLEAYSRSRESFVEGLYLLDTDYQVWDIPNGDVTMRAYYFPGEPEKPLLLFCNGYDGTVEECYFFSGASAIERGYPVILYEGPGQSMLIRQHNISFTSHWEEPVELILKNVKRDLPELSQSKKILYGISIGGHLSAQAASRLKGIDGLIINGGPMDIQQTVLSGMPQVAYNQYNNDKLERLDRTVNSAVKLFLSFQDRWAYNQLLWTFGQSSMSTLLKTLEDYNLDDFSRDIPVLILSGSEDLYEGIQTQYREVFPDADIYTFPPESGASSHCQAGALEQSALICFDWLERMF